MPKAIPTVVPESCRVKSPSRQVLFYYRNREKCSAKSNQRNKKLRAANPEAEREKNRAYANANRERIRETSRLRSLENREAYNSYQREWNARNPEKAKANGAASNHKRRKWMQESPNPPTGQQIYDLLAAATRCRYCNRKFGKSLTKTIDHVVPRQRDGIHELSNLVVACRSCNSSKSDRDPNDFARELGMLMLV